jgi:amino acid adenylation domain-containing protein
VPRPGRRSFLLSAQKRALLERQRHRGGDPAPGLAPIARQAGGGPAPLSFAQRRLWFLHQLVPGESAYNVAAVVRLRGRLAPAALAGSLAEVSRRHEVLRCRFLDRDGQPVQVAAVPGPVALPVADLAALPAPAAEAAWRRLAEGEMRRPFDLALGPPLRALLLRLGQESHLLVLSVHHVAADAGSRAILVRELAAIYADLAAGRAPSLPEPALQYSDYARWQRRELSDEALAPALAWWRRQLAGGVPQLDLPTDQPRPAVQSFRGGRVSRRLPPELAVSLAALGRGRGATPFMTLLAGVQALLHRYTGQRDVAVGAPAAERPRPELEGLVGCFVNLLVLRTDLSGAPDFATLLGRVREVVLAAQEHQQVPFERLVEELRPDRDLSRTPLLQVVFAVATTPRLHLDVGGLRLATVAVEPASAKFDLSITMAEREGGRDGVEMMLDYSADLFLPDTIERLAAHCERLLAAAVAEPGRPLATLPLLTAGEREQILVRWNDTAAAVPLDRPVHVLFEQLALRAPDAAAVVGDGDGLTLSAGELNRRANRLAHQLRRAGAGPEVRVGICAGPGADLVIGALAILKAGGAYVPLDPGYPPERLQLILDDAGIAVLLAGRDVGARLPRRPRLLPLPAEGGAAVAGDDLDPRLEVGPDHLAYAIYTSGSSGRPKGVEVTHGALLNLVFWHRRTYGVGPADRATQVAGVGFDAVVWELWPHLTAGASLHVASEETRALPARLMRWLVDHGITITFVPTPLAEALIAAGWPAGQGPGWLLTGGDRLGRRPPADGKPALVNHYGPTENAVVATSAAVLPAGQEPGLPPIGRPIANVRLYLLDRELQPVPVGVRGEIYLGGASLARGYLGRPDLTAAAFLPDPFAARPGARVYRTGDLGRWRPDGRVDFLGRADDQVKIRGFRIEPAEIEAVLEQHPAVRQAVVAAPERVPGERRLVAWVLADPAAAGAAELRAFAAARLPQFMVPWSIVALPALPLTAHGKIDRRALPEPPPASGSRAAPQTTLEAGIAAIFRDVLGVGEVGREDDFFALGGHSLKATELASRLNREHGVEIGLRELFAAPTVAGIAACLATRPPADLPELVPVAAAASYELSHAQRRLWILDQFEAESSAYNIPGVCRLEGELHLPALARALAALVERHEILRTVFTVAGGSPRQRVLPAAAVPLPVVDLSAAPYPEAAARPLLQAEANTPFDLAAGPLLRARLLVLGHRRHLLSFNIHHIVCDGWSMGVIYRELATHYGAELAGLSQRPSPLPVQYRDYAAWLNRLLTGPRLAAHRDHWLRRLAGAPDSVELPLDRPRPPVQTFNGRRVRSAVPEALTERLRQLGGASGSTLFMVLLAAFATLLWRHSGQADLVIGSPIAARTHPRLHDLVGFFVNTLALRTLLAPAGSFAALLAAVRETALDAYTHQVYPFDLLVEDLDRARDLSRPPVFNVMLAHNNTRGALGTRGAVRRAPPPPGLTVTPYAADDFNMSKFDLIWFVDEVGAGLQLRLEYNSDLFDEATLLRLRDAALSLLAGLAEQGAGRALRELPLLDERQRRQVLADFQGPRVDGGPRLLQPLWEAAVAAVPDAVAVVDTDGAGQLSYAELDRRAALVAAHLCRRHGIGRGHFVGLMMDRSPAMLAGVLGIVKAGAAYVAIDPAYPQDRVLHMLRDSATAVLITDRRRPELLAGYAGTVLDLGAGWPGPDAAAGGERRALPVNQPDDPVYVIYTSGSTGIPNGAMLSHALLANLLHWQRGSTGIDGGRRCLQFTSLNFCVSFQEIFGTLTGGGRLHLIDETERQDVAALMAALSRHQVEVLYLPFSYLNFLFNETTAWGAAFGHRLQHIVTAGEQLKISGAMLAFLEANPRLRLHNHYGSSEMHVVAAFTLGAAEAQRHPVPPVGRPIANTTIFILDRDLEPVPIGSWGELYVRGSGELQGYLNHPALTAAKLLPDPFAGRPGSRLYRTGDLGRWLASGDIEVHGRVDAQVKVRGFRVEPGEVESVLLKLPAVRDCVVVVRQEAGERRALVAYVVLHPAAAAGPGLAGIEAALRARLPQYLLPLLVPLPRLPLMPNGKVDRERLPEPASADAALGCEHVAPRNAIESRIAAIWCELLGRQRISVTESFFQLGGHSLKATQVIARIHQEWAVRVPLIELFHQPTIERLASLVEAGLAGGQGAAPGLYDKLSRALAQVESLSREELAQVLARTP